MGSLLLVAVPARPDEFETPPWRKRPGLDPIIVTSERQALKRATARSRDETGRGVSVAASKSPMLAEPALRKTRTGHAAGNNLEDIPALNRPVARAGQLDQTSVVLTSKAATTARRSSRLSPSARPPISRSMYS